MFINRDQPSMTQVKRPLPIPPLCPQFTRFLYASIGECIDEMPSSVLSALARQDLDPWEEAAHLAQLPRESAILRLTPMISSVSTEPSAGPAPIRAAQLLDLLPTPESPHRGRFLRWHDEAHRHFVPVVTYLIVGAIMLTSWLLGH
jgi:hypothetical protein